LPSAATSWRTIVFVPVAPVGNLNRHSVAGSIAEGDPVDLEIPAPARQEVGLTGREAGSIERRSFPVDLQRLRAGENEWALQLDRAKPPPHLDPAHRRMRAGVGDRAPERAGARVGGAGDLDGAGSERMALTDRRRERRFRGVGAAEDGEKGDTGHGSVSRAGLLRVRTMMPDWSEWPDGRLRHPSSCWSHASSTERRAIRNIRVTHNG
jgi:hypothetical protein